MSWQDIQREIAAALDEVTTELGGAPLRGVLIKDTPANMDVYPPQPAGESRYPITVMFDDYSPMEIDGGAVLSTDARLLVAAYGLAVPIDTNDRIQIGSETFYVANSPSMRPGGIALLYDVQARKR